MRNERSLEPTRTLAHPSKLLTAGDSALFVADTGHHRVLMLEIDPAARSARIVRTFGDGTAGFVDGADEVARFHSPHGLAHRGSTLYVADTENHAVRAIDLATGVVRTIAGTGEKAARHIETSTTPRNQALRSPWSLWIDPPRLFIAMAGSHQIFALEDEHELYPFAGDGREALVDGPVLRASFNRPSDLAGSEHALFVADAEASAVRKIALVGQPVVETLVGTGSFDWGDRDGVGGEVRLQHPNGLAFDGLLFIADSYNHKIKHMDPSTKKLARLIGTGEPGHVDGAFRKARFFQPEGLAVRENRLFIADTNNHAIRVADLDKHQVWTLTIAD